MSGSTFNPNTPEQIIESNTDTPLQRARKKIEKLLNGNIDFINTSDLQWKKSIEESIENFNNEFNQFKASLYENCKLENQTYNEDLKKHKSQENLDLNTLLKIETQNNSAKFLHIKGGIFFANKQKFKIVELLEKQIKKLNEKINSSEGSLKSMKEHEKKYTSELNSTSKKISEGKRISYENELKNINTLKQQEENKINENEKKKQVLTALLDSLQFNETQKIITNKEGKTKDVLNTTTTQRDEEEINSFISQRTNILNQTIFPDYLMQKLREREKSKKKNITVNDVTDDYINEVLVSFKNNPYQLELFIKNLFSTNNNYHLKDKKEMIHLLFFIDKDLKDQIMSAGGFVTKIFNDKIEGIIEEKIISREKNNQDELVLIERNFSNLIQKRLIEGAQFLNAMYSLSHPLDKNHMNFISDLFKTTNDAIKNTKQDNTAVLHLKLLAILEISLLIGHPDLEKMKKFTHLQDLRKQKEKASEEFTTLLNKIRNGEEINKEDTTTITTLYNNFTKIFEEIDLNKTRNNLLVQRLYEIGKERIDLISSFENKVSDNMLDQMRMEIVANNKQPKIVENFVNKIFHVYENTPPDLPLPWKDQGLNGYVTNQKKGKTTFEGKIALEILQTDEEYFLHIIKMILSLPNESHTYSNKNDILSILLKDESLKNHYTSPAFIKKACEAILDDNRENISSEEKLRQLTQFLKLTNHHCTLEELTNIYQAVLNKVKASEREGVDSYLYKLANVYATYILVNHPVTETLGEVNITIAGVKLYSTSQTKMPTSANAFKKITANLNLETLPNENTLNTISEKIAKINILPDQNRNPILNKIYELIVGHSLVPEIEKGSGPSLKHGNDDDL